MDTPSSDDRLARKRGRMVKSVEKRKSLVRKRKSLRAQHSISLHIPMNELSGPLTGMNCYIDLPRQVFNLTYLECNDTNPDSLNTLDCLKRVRWQGYRLGFIYNFDYKSKTVENLVKHIDNSLKKDLNEDKVHFSTVSILDSLSPTEFDNQALEISIVQRTSVRDKTVFKAYLLSWCNPAPQRFTYLPVLLCRGATRLRNIVFSVLKDRHSVNISRLTLMQDDFQQLMTYCLIMLDKSTDEATTTYKIQPGSIKLSSTVETLLNLWEKIHKDDNNQIELDDVLLFHEALESFYESVFGLKLGNAHYYQFAVAGSFCICVDSLMWLNNTKVVHVVLKFLNYTVAQELKLRFDRTTVPSLTA